MSDEMPTSRDGIADAITADLTAMDTAATPPEPEAPAAAAVTPTDPTPPTDTPASVAEVPTTPLKLTDKSLVEDPATGEMVEWGKIKAERLRWKDYTQKRMSEAETIRQYEAQESKRQAAFDAWQAQQKAASMPDLPEDDPYAQRIRAMEAQTKYLAEVDAQRQAAFNEQMQAAQLEKSRAALEIAEKKLATDYGFKQREIDMVEAEFYRRGNSGEDVTLDSVAKEYKAYISSVKEEAVQEFKTKHRVQAPAAGISVPAAGSPENVPVPGTRGFVDAIREEFGAMMR